MSKYKAVVMTSELNNVNFMATSILRRALIVEGKIHTEDLSVINMYKINNTVLKLIKQKPYAGRRNRLQERISRLIYLC